MTETKIKPLNWHPEPGIGYTVERRPDGGMNLRFTSIDEKTLHHWRAFALEHLFDSDRLTRNLYDLTQLDSISEETVRFAVEANSDPSARNIRLAVVVKSEEVANAIRQVGALSTAAPGGGTEMKLFTDLEAAENWLNRPIDILT